MAKKLMEDKIIAFFRKYNKKYNTILSLIENKNYKTLLNYAQTETSRDIVVKKIVDLLDRIYEEYQREEDNFNYFNKPEYIPNINTKTVFRDVIYGFEPLYNKLINELSELEHFHAYFKAIIFFIEAVYSDIERWIYDIVHSDFMPPSNTPEFYQVLYRDTINCLEANPIYYGENQVKIKASFSDFAALSLDINKFYHLKEIYGDLVDIITIISVLHSHTFLDRSIRTLESLNGEVLIDIFKKNFDTVKTFDDMERVFNCLKKVIDTKIIADFYPGDLLYEFLGRKDANAMRSIGKLRHSFNFSLHNPSEEISFSKGNVIFNHNKQVVGLQIRGVDVEQIILHILELENLQKLHLINTKLRELPESFGKLKSLKHLNLSSEKPLRLTDYSSYHKIRNTIKDLPDSFKNLENLESLNLSRNQITEIKGLDGLRNLRDLSFLECKITEIKNLDHLTNLTSLELHDNLIKEIKGLSKLTNLQSLDLGDNLITEIKGLETLINLTRLNLQHNEITEVKGLGTLSKLSWLSIFFNPVMQQFSITHDPNREHFYVFGELKIKFTPKDVQKLVEYCRNAKR